MLNYFNINKTNKINLLVILFISSLSEQKHNDSTIENIEEAVGVNIHPLLFFGI